MSDATKDFLLFLLVIVSLFVLAGFMKRESGTPIKPREENTSYIKNEAGTKYAFLSSPASGRSDSPSMEFVQIEMSPNNKGAVDVSGWYLEGRKAKTKYALGKGHETVRLPLDEAPKNIVAKPSEKIYAFTGIGPIGSSYKMNSCSGFITNVQDYNLCFNDHRNDSDFFKPEWRVYFGKTTEAWNDDHDVIVLYNGKGQIIDWFSY